MTSVYWCCDTFLSCTAICDDWEKCLLLFCCVEFLDGGLWLVWIDWGALVLKLPFDSDTLVRLFDSSATISVSSITPWLKIQFTEPLT